MPIAACSRLNPGEMRNFIHRVLGWQRGSAGPFSFSKHPALSVSDSKVTMVTG